MIMTDKPEAKKEEKKPIIMVGKRKKAVARATFRPGRGRITINSVPIEQIDSDLMRLRIQEPLMIAGESVWKRWDVSVNVRGGGNTGQIDAARQAVARGLVEVADKGLKEKYMTMDRNLLVFDPRRTEPHKPPRSSQGPRRYKQRSKR
jgi:small subunit ribosomal protein S9